MVFNVVAWAILKSSSVFLCYLSYMQEECMLLNLCFSPVCLLLQGPFSQESGMVQEKLFFLLHNIVVFVMPDVQMPEWEE